EIDAIFVPTSSATGLIGIYLGYKEIIKDYPQIKIPSFHAAQTEKIHPIAREFDSDFSENENSIAGAISDRVAHRKDAAKEIIKETKGSGWVLSDEDIKNAIELNKSLGIDYDSPNSNLALAAYIKALKNNFEFEAPCLIFSGT
ncbi:MAG: hypothetical protein KDC82_04730, partial [Bacteroidetes bacterium]|nr:hypothetical protein [Bacteroidota bacterium]